MAQESFTVSPMSNHRSREKKKGGKRIPAYEDFVVQVFVNELVEYKAGFGAALPRIVCFVACFVGCCALYMKGEIEVEDWGFEGRQGTSFLMTGFQACQSPPFSAVGRFGERRYSLGAC